MENQGKLYLIATPIGNLEDITIRALNILKQVDLVAAEDTRRTQKLLNHYEIKVKSISYHSHNEHHKTNNLLSQVLEGKQIAVLSDAGTPSIADPGFLIVREAIKQGVEPIIIPGVSSLTFAATAAGLPVDKFSFYGFLPVKKGRRHKMLEKFKDMDQSIFIFESPYRMKKLINEICEIISPDTQIAIIREATKMYEEILRGTALEIKKITENKKWKGENVICIARTIQ